MLPHNNHNPGSNLDFADWRQVEELMEVVPFNNQRPGVQQPRPDNQPTMSFSADSSNFNFWASGPVSINIYPGENSHFHFHQTSAPNLNYLQPAPSVQSPPHLSTIPHLNGHRFETPNPVIGFPSPMFSDAVSSVGGLNDTEIQQLPSTPLSTPYSTPSTFGASSSGQTSNVTSPPDVHHFTPRYSTEYLHEFFDWDLQRARLDEGQAEAEPSEQIDPMTSTRSAPGGAGTSPTVPSPRRPRSRYTAGPVSRPATRAFTRQQKNSI